MLHAINKGGRIMDKGLLAVWVIVIFIVALLSNAWGRVSVKRDVENFDIIKIHTDLREINEYSYCPYCGKELKNADSN